ncbi:MAG: AAA family ATPase [Gemmatimonadota bacterium]|nr:MAG: AAA family ATPase [Gemmatimonadota bacterium]
MSALARARAADSLPESMLVHGPPGVGKQRVSLWIGQLLLCSAPGPEGPCGECKSCRLAVSLEHPDLHWYFPLPRPKGSKTPEKLAAALEEARMVTLAERREEPFQASVPGTEPVGLYLAIARSLRSRAQKRPSMGPRQVFVIARAESLVPQEANQEAGNALLKLLEEPPEGTTLILTTSAPGQVMATIRSRTQPLYVPPLSREEVRRFLSDVVGTPDDQAERAACLARGSVGRALGFLPEADEAGPLEEVRRKAFTLLRAAISTNAAAGLSAAIGFPPARARGLLGLFAFLQEALRDLAAVASGAHRSVVDADTLEFLQKAVLDYDIQPLAAARALDLVEEASRMAAGNVNPQLIVAGLIMDLRRALTVPATAAGGTAR